MGEKIETTLNRLFWSVLAMLAAFAFFSAYQAREADLAAIRVGCEREALLGIPIFNCECAASNFRAENHIWDYLPIIGTRESLTSQQFQDRYRNLVMRCPRA